MKRPAGWAGLIHYFSDFFFFAGFGFSSLAGFASFFFAAGFFAAGFFFGFSSSAGGAPGSRSPFPFSFALFARVALFSLAARSQRTQFRVGVPAAAPPG